MTVNPVDVIFIYDRSGSMTEADVETEIFFIETAIKEFDRIIESLQVFAD